MNVLSINTNPVIGMIIWVVASFTALLVLVWVMINQNREKEKPNLRDYISFIPYLFREILTGFCRQN